MSYYTLYKEHRQTHVVHPLCTPGLGWLPDFLVATVQEDVYGNCVGAWTIYLSCVPGIGGVIQKNSIEGLTLITLQPRGWGPGVIKFNDTTTGTPDARLESGTTKCRLCPSGHQPTIGLLGSQDENALVFIYISAGFTLALVIALFPISCLKCC